MDGWKSLEVSEPGKGGGEGSLREAEDADVGHPRKLLRAMPVWISAMSKKSSNSILCMQAILACLVARCLAGCNYML